MAQLCGLRAVTARSWLWFQGSSSVRSVVREVSKFYSVGCEKVTLM